MNINKFLCSKFEPNKDGKVTIGHIADFALKLTILASIVSLIILWIGGVFTYLCENVGILTEQDIPQYVVDGELVASIIFFFGVGLVALLLIVVIIAIVLLLAYIVDRICSIPIAECHVSKKDDDGATKQEI